MKCVSIAQPFAWAILAGVQKNDYRCFATDYRGDVLIHAARGTGDWERRQLGVFGEHAPRWEDLLFDRVFGLVELCSCEPGESGEWIWQLRNPRAIEPFWIEPGKGLFDVEEQQITLMPANGRNSKKKKVS